jgi:hypothetical protein
VRGEGITEEKVRERERVLFRGREEGVFLLRGGGAGA